MNEYCDCSDRCPRCGKLIKQRVTWITEPRWRTSVDLCGC